MRASLHAALQALVLLLALLPLAACGSGTMEPLALGSALYHYRTAQMQAPVYMSPEEGASYADSVAADAAASAAERAAVEGFRLPDGVEVVYEGDADGYYIHVRGADGYACHYDSRDRLRRSPGVRSIQGSYCGESLPPFDPTPDPGGAP